ncbi:MAG: glycosyltransferase family 4 protein [Coriobacteriia bacterium]|nr:glycosyltransferase family 4 protein [Coriobacteriia bacterium]
MREVDDTRSICFHSPRATSLFDEGSPGGHGGAELVMYHLACELSKRSDFDVHFLLDEIPAKRADDCQISLHPIEAAVARSEGPRVLFVLTNAVRAMRSFVRTRSRDYVLCGASVTLGYVTLLRQVLRRKRVLFILASDADAEGGLLQGGGYERAMFQLGMRLADVVWCQNQYQQQQVRERFGRRAEILPNGLPIPPAPPEAEKDYVLWVSSCQELKQPHAYLDLAQQMADERFVMIMPPRKDKGLFAEVEARAGELPNVEFINGVHYRDIQPYFDCAKVFVNTSTVEGYPNTFVQSMMGATPILSLNVDPSAILSERGLGLCACGDTGVLAENLEALLADPERRSEMGRRAFEYAREHHDIVRVAALFERTLRQIT